MKYPRPPYMAPGIPVEKSRVLFSGEELDTPRPDFPITPLENFKLAAAHKTPYWVPNSLTDFQEMLLRDLAAGGQTNCEVDLSRDTSVTCTYDDWFGCNWTWVPSAGGPMLTPGTQRIDDITKWEKEIKFPKLSDFDWETPAAEFLKNKYDPAKVLHLNIGQSCTERLVAILGGYEESMMSLLVEPEAVRDFLMRYSEFLIGLVDKVCALYPVTLMTLHDDWGTEKDTFFSENVMEELVYEPTKRVVDHIRSKNVIFQLHSCGKIERFLPYIMDLGIDFIQIQRRANNMPMYKEQYGDRIGLNSYTLEGFVPGVKISKEEYIQMIRKTVDLYAKSGGYYTAIMPEEDPERTWDGIFELFCYSREYYDKERGA